MVADYISLPRTLTQPGLLVLEYMGNVFKFIGERGKFLASWGMNRLSDSVKSKSST